MDFIERIFGVSPDGGSGSTEAMILLAITAVLVIAVRRRRSTGAN
jgi:MYXO-CTERM domain-containing protein